MLKSLFATWIKATQSPETLRAAIGTDVAGPRNVDRFVAGITSGRERVTSIGCGAEGCGAEVAGCTLSFDTGPNGIVITNMGVWIFHAD